MNVKNECPFQRGTELDERLRASKLQSASMASKFWQICRIALIYEDLGLLFILHDFWAQFTKKNHKMCHIFLAPLREALKFKS